MKKPEKRAKPRRPAAEIIKGVPWLERVQNYFFLHGQTAVSSLGRMRRAPIASAMTILVIAIALSLPASLHLLVKNASQASGSIEETNRISLFLKPDLGNEVGRKIAEKLARHPYIAEATLITKEAGLKEFREYSGFGDVLKVLDFNPLPAVIALQPKNSPGGLDQIEKLLAELRAMPESDSVQLDTEWLRKLHALLTVARRTVVVLGGLLGLAVLFIVGNTIRLELQQRREEIAVTQLMGASDGFIRRPFLYTGLWYGLSGGLIAWILVGILMLLLRSPLQELAQLYGGQWSPVFLDFGETGQLIAAATLLGIAGALAVVTHYLRRLNPH